MGINDYLAEELVGEFAEGGKKISFELARLTVMVRTYDGLIRDFLIVNNKMLAEEISGMMGVSVRFAEITMARYGYGKMKEHPADLQEQIAEMRAMDARENEGKEIDLVRYVVEKVLRCEEQINAVDVFLTNTDYSIDKIADLVGVSVSFVEELQSVWVMLKNKKTQGVMHT
jgi:hypothetical protein